MSEEDKKHTSLVISRPLWSALKHLSIDTGKTLAELIEEALREKLEREAPQYLKKQ